MAARAYSSSDLTNPSHATLLTGLSPAAHGVHTLQSPLPADVPTLAEELRAFGLHPAAVVSVNHLRPDYSGLDRGFEPYHFPEGPPRPAEETVELALTALRETPNPFVLWVHFFDPHMPYDPPPPWRDLPLKDPSLHRHFPPLETLIAQDHVPFPYRSWLEGQDLAQLPALYAAEVARADHALGRVFKAAERKDTALVVAVTSDHGEGFGEHRIYFNHFGLHEEMVRVPLVMACRVAIPEPTLVREPVPSTSVFAALRDISLRRSWQLAPGDPLLQMRHQGARGLRQGGWKVIENVGAVAPLPRGAALFDLESDPGETRDRTEVESVRARLLEALHRRIEADETAGPAPELQLSPEERERLEALGYVQPSSPDSGSAAGARQ